MNPSRYRIRAKGDLILTLDSPWVEAAPTVPGGGGPPVILEQSWPGADGVDWEAAPNDTPTVNTLGAFQGVQGGVVNFNTGQGNTPPVSDGTGQVRLVDGGNTAGIFVYFYEFPAASLPSHYLIEIEDLRCWNWTGNSVNSAGVAVTTEMGNGSVIIQQGYYVRARNSNWQLIRFDSSSNFNILAEPNQADAANDLSCTFGLEITPTEVASYRDGVEISRVADATYRNMVTLGLYGRGVGRLGSPTSPICGPIRVYDLT
jgi:hypothetical protein